MSTAKPPRKGPPDPAAPICEGCIAANVRLPARARFGDPPRWCSNHDPGQADRRRQAGRRRRPRFGGSGVDPKTLPTIDRIVDYALDVAGMVEKGKLDPQAGRSVAQLLGKAIDGLKARGSVGDLLPQAGKGKDAPERPQASKQAEPGSLESLDEELDS